jgi:hypothetical protein
VKPRFRHTRQTRLAEVGDAGQARLGAASVDVRGPGLSGVVEALYLAGAGVGEIGVREDGHGVAARAMDATVRLRPARVGEATARARAPEGLDALDPAAREVAVGAWRALDAVRAILELRHGGA